MGFSQEQNRPPFRSVDMKTDNFNVSLSDNNAGEVVRTRLNIPDDYELRIQTVKGTRDQTIEKGSFGRVRERYAQYYRGIRIEHSDIRMHYFNDSLVLIGADYINVPSIDMTIVLSEENAIQRAKEHIGARVFMWEDEAKTDIIRNIINDEVAELYPRAELVISKNRIDFQDTMVYLAYKIDVFAKEPLRHD
jgi:Zn-dependent metalloprotease